MTQGRKHKYFGMKLEFQENGELLVNMRKYMQDMLNTHDKRMDSKA